MGVARMLVTPELLRELLHLPYTTDIVMAGMDRENIELVVRDPALRDVVLSELERLPLVTPTFRKNVPVEFIEWGQQ
jgi:hypothetical protein